MVTTIRKRNKEIKRATLRIYTILCELGSGDISRGLVDANTFSEESV